jgi:signal transduction histidine kinase
MRGQIDVALREPGNSEQAIATLRVLSENVDRLARLVGSLLTLARADAGQLRLEREDVDIGALLESVAEQMKPVAEDRGVTLTVEPGPAAIVRADQDLILQLVLNLVDNAIKFTPSAGSVTLGWDAAGGWATFWVSDTGEGIPEEHRPHIFERFYRVDRARARGTGGAGLGLSISRWIAEAHGGTIAVEASAEGGARFTVSLPPF